MPCGYEPDDALWAALAECESQEEMQVILRAWVTANDDFWAAARPSPAGWEAPEGLRPGVDWTPPDGVRPRPERMPFWVRAWYHTPFAHRQAYEWMWHHGGFDVLPPASRQA